MSRTYRQDPDNIESYESDDPEELGSKGKGRLSLSKKLKGRDKKPRSKSSSWYKKMRSQQRRAKRKASLQNSPELHPIEKKDNDWDWN